jgi:hypothetical protein
MVATVIPSAARDLADGWLELQRARSLAALGMTVPDAMSAQDDRSPTMVLLP